MSFTPPRKTPVKGKNTYKPGRAPGSKKNTPKASTGPQSNVMKYLVMAAMSGAAFAVLKDAMAAPGSDEKPTGQSTQPPTQQPTPQTAPPTVTKPATPTPAPKPKTVYTPAPTVKTNYVFVDSWNGEGIYATTSPFYNDYYGNGRNRIVQLSDKCFVGLWTGKKQDNMLQIYVSTTAGGRYNFWIAADEVKIFDKAGYDTYMAGEGKAKVGSELDAIVEYFK